MITHAREPSFVAEHSCSVLMHNIEVYISGGQLLSHALAHFYLLAFASCQSSLFLYPSVHFDFGRHFSRNHPLRVESIHNTVKMQFKNLAILAAAGTAVAEFAIITTPIPTNLGEVLTNVRSPIYASSFSNL